MGNLKIKNKNTGRWETVPYASTVTASLIINIVDNSGNLSANYKYGEIISAHASGRDVRCYFKTLTLPLIEVSSKSCVFTCIYDSVIWTAEVAQDNTVTVSTKKINDINAENGGLGITDDGNGNVTIAAAGAISIIDDGEGNVTIK